MKYYSLVRMKTHSGSEYVCFYIGEPLCYKREEYDTSDKIVIKITKYKGMLTRLMEIINDKKIKEWNFIHYLIINYYYSFPSLVNHIEIEEYINITKTIKEIFKAERYPTNVCIMYYEVNYKGDIVTYKYTIPKSNRIIKECVTEYTGNLKENVDSALYLLVKGDYDISNCTDGGVR